MDHHQLMGHQGSTRTLPPSQVRFPCWGKCLPSLANSFPRSLSLQESHRVLQSPSLSLPSKVPENMPLARGQKDWPRTGSLHPTASQPQMLAFSSPSLQVPPHHPGLALSGMRNPINPTKNRGYCKLSSWHSSWSGEPQAADKGEEATRPPGLCF